MVGLVPFLTKTGRRMMSSFIHPERGYEKAREPMEQYYNQGQQYLSPYHTQGQEAYGQLQNYMNSYANPEQLYSRFAGSYETSPATRMAQERARNSSLDIANAMGLGGATTTAQALQAENQRIEADAMERYIDRLINQYERGANIAQGIYGTGAGAAGQLGQNAIMHGQNMGQLAYNQQNAPGELFANLLSMAGQGVGNYYALQNMRQGQPAGGTEYSSPQSKFSATGSYGGR